MLLNHETSSLIQDYLRHKIWESINANFSTLSTDYITLGINVKTLNHVNENVPIFYNTSDCESPLPIFCGHKFHLKHLRTA